MEQSESESERVCKTLSENKLAMKVIDYKYSIRKLYFAPLVLAKCIVILEKTQNTDFFQNTCFKENNNMAAEKFSKSRQAPRKNNVFQLSHGIRNIH